VAPSSLHQEVVDGLREAYDGSADERNGMRFLTSDSESGAHIPVSVLLTLFAVVIAVVAYMGGIAVRHRYFRTLDATIRFVGVEGGCWLLETPDQRFNVRLEKPFQIDGARVAAVVEPQPDAISTCQIGPVARVESIAFKVGGSVPNNSLERSRER
jgi:hypothetical protein